MDWSSQAYLSMGFSRQGYWSGLLSSRGSYQPRDWTHISCSSCIAGGFLPLSHQGSPTLLLIHPIYNSLPLLIPNSHSFSPLPIFPFTATNLFSISVSLSLFHRYVDLYCILDSTYKWYHIVFVFLFLTSLSMVISRSIHVAVNGIISFFWWLNSVPLCVCMFVCVFMLLLPTC